MKKVVIVGVSASGKSTLARRLGKKTNLPVIFMDALMWKPGWEYIGDEATKTKLQEVVKAPEWIIEGYITKKARTFLFSEADTIIYLDYSLWVISWRYVKRWWKHRTTARPELEGSPETFSFRFLKLVWTKGEAVSLEHFLGQVADQTKIITLTSPKIAERFLSTIL